MHRKRQFSQHEMYIYVIFIIILKKVYHMLIITQNSSPYRTSIHKTYFKAFLMPLFKSILCIMLWLKWVSKASRFKLTYTSVFCGGLWNKPWRMRPRSKTYFGLRETFKWKGRESLKWNVICRRLRPASWLCKSRESEIVNIVWRKLRMNSEIIKARNYASNWIS